MAVVLRATRGSETLFSGFCERMMLLERSVVVRGMVRARRAERGAYFKLLSAGGARRMCLVSMCAYYGYYVLDKVLK